MLQTVEAEIDINGAIKLLEPVKVSRRTRAIVTLLEEADSEIENRGNGAALLAVLRENRLPADALPGAEEIEAQITEARESWD